MLLCKKIKQFGEIGINWDDFQDDFNLGMFEFLELGKDFQKYDRISKIQTLHKMVKKCPKVKIEPWQRSLQDEIFKDNLKIINPTIKERERLKVEHGCPGDVDYLPGSLKSNQLNKPTFGHKDRTTIQVKSLTPGPGTYGKNHIPDQLYQEKKGQFVSFSNIPDFEKYQCGRNPCKKLTLLAPNQYCPIDKTAVSIRLPTKNVSKRGPYDLFTGPRTNENNKSYFGQSTIKKSYCSKMFYETTKSSLDQLLNDPKNTKKGKFFKSPRFRNYVFELDALENDQFLIKPSPTPTSYNPVYPRSSYKDKVKWNPFNSTNYNVRPDAFDPTLPGPGRYVSTQKNKPKKSWPFLTKYTRGYFQPPKAYNSF